MSDDLAGWLLEQIAEDERENSTADEPVSWCDRSAGTHYEHGRIAAECDAKRRIIGEVVPRLNSEEDWAHSMAGVGPQPPYEDSVRLLRLLALPYTDRPGYREEWRPE